MKITMIADDQPSIECVGNGHTFGLAVEDLISRIHFFWGNKATEVPETIRLLKTLTELPLLRTARGTNYTLTLDDTMPCPHCSALAVKTDETDGGLECKHCGNFFNVE